jgi:membrane protease YdiL (CAAX protease family)
MKQFNHRLFLLLFLAGLVCAAAVIPYVFTSSGISSMRLPVPISAFVLVQIVQSAILLAVAVAIGVMLAPDTGLGAPYLAALAARKKRPHGFWHVAILALVVGFVTSLAVIALDALLFGTVIGTSLVRSTATPLWQRVLAAFYGGIDEELLMRFFLMTAFAWVFGWAARGKGHKPTSFGMWASIILTAAIFSIGHLPFTSSVAVMSRLVILRALILNGVAGIIFGWLYWKKGLEASMIAHFAASLTLLILLPSIVQASV